MIRADFSKLDFMHMDLRECTGHCSGFVQLSRIAP
jgi:hypothetical protein